MVRNGFSLDEIHNSTIDQIKLYMSSIHKMNSIEQINSMSSTRVGYHADEKAFKKITDSISKGIN